MKVLNFSDVGQMRKRKGTSMKRMINEDVLNRCKPSVSFELPV